MGKDQELLQAVKTEDLMTVQKLLQRPKPGKASRFCLIKKAFTLLLAMLLWLIEAREIVSSWIYFQIRRQTLALPFNYG